MVSPLKGLTRAQIAARAAARRAAEAAKKANKKRGSTAAKKGRVRVTQRTVNAVLKMGRSAARAAAAKPGASAEFKEAVNRVYPARKTKRKS